MSQTLFSPLQLNGSSLNNRIVMAPMTRCRALGNVPNDLIATYYAQRATAGLIVTEGTSPSPNGLGYARIPGIYNDAQIEGWKKTTKAVHEKGGKIFLQIMHTGRVSHSANMPAGSKIVAPSAISADGNMWTDSQGMQKTEMPEAMTTAEVKSTIQEYVQAAKNAIAAGFDGVEIHSANGYLPNQFLNPGSNVRTDEYGGSTENRCRFVLEIAQQTADAIGSEKTGIRFSPYNPFNAMQQFDETFETYDYLSKELNKMGIAYIHLLDASARVIEEGLELIAKIRENFDGIYILNAGYDKERATHALSTEEADMIAFGTKFISNPDLPYRFKNDLELAAPDQNTFYTADAVGYTDYPFSEN
ncbi:MAG: alkene reductase [Bacteroidetes bacterium]|nr:alkene reductase [Bacteroidota bacterium]